MLLAEDVMMLLLDDDSGKVVNMMGEHSLGLPLAGALTVELAMRGRLAVSEEKPSRLKGPPSPRVTDGSPLGEPLLDHAIRVLEKHQDDPAATSVTELSKGLPERVGDSLVERGLLRRDEDKVLGLIPRRSWPAVDSSYEQELRKGLTEVIAGSRRPDERQACLLTVLSTSNYLASAFRPKDLGMSRGELTKRGKELVDGAAADVLKGVEQVQAAAVMAAITPVIITSAAGSGGS